MSTKTKCEKCLFADYADSNDACAMGILEHIEGSKTINIVDNFNEILHYRCPFAFSVDVYKEHNEQLGSIDNLKQELIKKAQVNYYLTIFLDANDLDNVCNSINGLPIVPQFVSIVVQQNNDTANIISKLENLLSKEIKWKLHNFLEEYTLQDSLDTIFKTNTHTASSNYFWVNTSKSSATWANDITKINSIIVVEQPFLHALFRADNDGLFLTFKNYEQIITLYNSDIMSSIKNIKDPAIRYYA
jgi:hypothetical protein